MTPRRCWPAWPSSPESRPGIWPKARPSPCSCSPSSSWPPSRCCGWRGGPRWSEMSAAQARRLLVGTGHAGTLFLFVVFSAFPFYWMLVTAFKRTNDLMTRSNNPFIFNLPPTLENLQILFRDTLYLRWLANTLFVGVIVVAITLVLTLPAGYALARLAGRWG